MGIDANAEIGLVRLTVRDLGRVQAFYEETLGLQATAQSSRSVTLSSSAGRPLVSLRGDRAAGAADHRGPGLYHIALLVPTRRDLAAMLFRLSARGIRLTGAADHFVSEALYLDDPEGNGIEIYRDRPRSAWPRDDHGRPVIGTIALDLGELAGELGGEPPEPGAAAGLAGETRVGHIHLQVSELRRSEAFYAGVLGFEVTFRDLPGALFLSAGGYHHHVGFNTWRSAGAAQATERTAGLRSFEVRLPTQAALADVIDRVVADELPLEHIDDGTLVHDPSGNAVLLSA